MTDLSPAAQAVLDAFNERHELCGPFDGNWPELCLAAALQAVADQVAPKDVPEMHNCCHELLESVHKHINEIAAELEVKGND